MLQASEDFEAQDVGMAVLQGLDIEPESKQLYGFQSIFPSPREVIGAFDKLVASAKRVSVVCGDQLDGLISITRQEGDDAPSEGQFLDEIANGLMDLAQDCPHSLITISCLRQTWKRIETKAVQSAASRFPTVLRFEPIPSPEVGEALIEAYFKRAYGRAGFTPPYPTWPIRSSAFHNAQDYTPRRLIELAKAHVQKCRQSRVVKELEAFPGADGVGGTERASEPDLPLATPPRLDANEAFETFDAEFHAARKAAKIDGALTENQVDNKLPSLLQAGLIAWIDESGSCGSFSVDGLPGPNPPLHARLRKVLDLDTEEEVHWSIRAVMNAHHISVLNRLRQAITASGLGLARGKRNLIILRNGKWASGEVTQRVLSEFTKLGGTILKLEASDLAVFDALSVLRHRHGDAIKPWLQSRRPAGSTRLLSAMLSDLGGAAPSSPPQPASPAAGTGSDSPSLAAKVVAAFGRFNLSVEALGVVKGPQVERIKLKPAFGVKVASLTNRAADLQVALALDEPPLIKPSKGFVVLDLPRHDRETLPLLNIIRDRKNKEKKGSMAFAVGVGVEGEPILSDLSDSNTCHVLVAGTSGSGKSEWLKSVVASLTLAHPPEHVRVALVDPKILTFAGVKGSPYLWRPVATDIDSALAILVDAVTEMESRYLTLSQQGFVSLADRCQAGLFDLPFLVLVFDEFADLILAGRDEKKEFEAMAARVAGKGRAAGIHLILATQRPDKSVVTGLIKSNLPMKVCLRVANATNSQIVLGESGAESLLGKGDLLCDMGKGIVRAQSYFIPQADFAKALKV